MVVDSQFALQVAAILLGSGGVQVIVKLVSRRSEIRNAALTTDATMLTSANSYVVSLQSQLDKQSERADTKEKDHIQDLKVVTQQLERANAENARLAEQLASLRTELNIAKGQIEQLQRRFI